MDITMGVRPCPLLARYAMPQNFLDIPKPQYTGQGRKITLAEHEQTSTTRNEAIQLAFKSGAYKSKGQGLTPMCDVLQKLNELN